MKLIKMLDKEANNLVSDATTQTILRELVTSEHCISELALKLNIPTLKLWRKMQKLLKADLVELTRTEKTGNIEKKLYRATATWYTPQQYLIFNPKDANLKIAFEIYSNIQKSMMTKLSAFGDVPKDADPIDFALFANMHVFAEVCGKPQTQTEIAALEKQLAKFRQ
jgi:hypothetical protein